MSDAVTVVSTPEGVRVLKDVLDGKYDQHVRDAWRDPLAVACDRYLEAKRIQLWAHFSIARTEDRWDAAVWLAAQIRGVSEFGGETGVDSE